MDMLIMMDTKQDGHADLEEFLTHFLSTLSHLNDAEFEVCLRTLTRTLTPNGGVQGANRGVPRVCCVLPPTAR